MKFPKKVSAWVRLIVAATLLVSVWQLTAQTPPPDADLYYRRTHDGELPGPGVNPSDHSGETTNTTTKVAPPSSQPGNIRPAVILDNGVDPANLGKGDWIWQLPTCTNHLGGYVSSVNDVQSLINWETNHGMQWITVKCGDGGTIWSQFNANLVATAHNAGLKIFGWAYAYGNDVPGEINVALNALNLGADGFIIDAESEYETTANNVAKATQYASAIKAAYPTRFLAHAPFPIISVHSGFPYVAFGTYCDAVMPQAYWAAIGGTNYAITMVTRMNTEWRNWQNSLTGAATNAIKPIVPIGGGYNSGSQLVDGTQITAFVNALHTNTPPAAAGGYHGLSWWSCQHHAVPPDKWPAIGGSDLNTNAAPAYFQTQPLSRVVDVGHPVSLSVSAYGASGYQWLFNGASLPGETNNSLSFASAQLANTGNYTCVISNSINSATSSVATLTVYPVQTTVFADSFDSNTAGNW
ncbi:MAG TPA: immunoglobulin domain-containing protein, partial [Verrucomicrobiae bacterium]|nr:immunoglobulin domain-containing protein [Verrucomicrobiae bacterium]